MDGQLGCAQDASRLLQALDGLLAGSRTDPVDTQGYCDPLYQLSKRLNRLIEYVNQNNAFAAQLSVGQLDAAPPEEGNALSPSLKMLHKNLLALTHQAQQIERGDLKQQVTHMGTLSSSISRMVRTLEERDAELQTENAQRTHAQEELKKSYRIMEQVIDESSDSITVYGGDGEVLFANRMAKDTQLDELNNRLLFSRLRISVDYTGEKAWEDVYSPMTRRWSRCNLSRIHWFDERFAYLMVVHDITEHKQREESILRQARMDLHTGVYNRAGGLALLKDLMRDSEQFPMCMCFIDIDFLKEVNDRFGHAEGDVLIATVADVIKSSIRACDLVLRMGGDEFLIVLPLVHYASAKRAIDRMMNALCNRLIEMKKPYRASFSCGIEEVQSIGELSLQELIARADKRMYEAKRERHAKRHAASTE